MFGMVNNATAHVGRCAWMVFSYLISSLKNMVTTQRLTVEEASDEIIAAAVLDTSTEFSATELKEWFDGKEFQAIYFKNSIKEAYYLTGYGTREHQRFHIKPFINSLEFDVRYKLV